MLEHARIWAAIEALAARQGLSVSALARLAGLDATTFNRSKRRNATGQLRWPSTESIAKILNATGVSIEEFLDIAAEKPGEGLSIPLRQWADTAQGWFSSSGQTLASGWGQLSFPDIDEQGLFALEINSGRFLPLYRDRDIIVLSSTAQLRRGDRMLIVLQDGRMDLALFDRRAGEMFHARSLASTSDLSFLLADVASMHRIIWASQ